MGGCTSTKFKMPNEKRFRRSIKLYQVSDVRSMTNILNRNRCFETGETPLTLAALQGHEAVVAALLKAGADPNLPDSSGRAPIHVAVQMNDAETLEILLSNNADVNRRDANDITPLQIAAHRGYTAIVETLIGAGANPNAAAGCTSPVLYAIAGGHSETVSALLDGEADPNCRSESGESAVAIAVAGGDVTSSRLLLSHRDVILTTEDSRKLIEVATLAGNVELLETLLSASPVASRGASIWTTKRVSQQSDEETPPALVGATAIENIKCVDALLRAGADVTVTDRRGQTALHIAVMSVIELERRTYYARYFSNVYRLHHKRDLNEIAPDKCIKCIMSLVQAGADVTRVWDRFAEVFPRRDGITFEQMVVCEVLVQAFGFRGMPIGKVRTFVRSLMALREYGLVKLTYSAGVDATLDDVGVLKVTSSDTSRDLDLEMLEYVRRICSNPRRLKDRCRQEVRRMLSWNTLYLVNKLPLPEETKDFLCIVDTEYYTDNKH